MLSSRRLGTSQRGGQELSELEDGEGRVLRNMSSGQDQALILVDSW